MRDIAFESNSAVVLLPVPGGPISRMRVLFNVPLPRASQIRSRTSYHCALLFSSLVVVLVFLLLAGVGVGVGAGAGAGAGAGVGSGAGT